MKKFIYILLFMFPVVAFAQQPWYKYSPMDYAWKDVGDTGFSAGAADCTSLAFNQTGQAYVAFVDVGNSYNATVMKFDGTNWVYVGNAGFSAGEANYTSLAFSPSNGQPYVAFIDWRASVMTFNGTNWVYVGSEGFSEDEIDYTSLAFGTSGQPYVAYGGDDDDEASASVMKFDGTNWVYVGTADFSVGAAGYTSLAFSPVDSMPYVAFSDEGNWFFGPESVMKFDGTNWVNVGNADFTGNYVVNSSLAFSPSGQPYVAFEDANDYEASVMKFDGTNWVYVGNAGVSTGGANYTSLAFSPSGQPYVAFQDFGNSEKATVMKFDGTNWVYVGTAGFSVGAAGYTSLAFSPSGVPYVAYTEGANSGRATVMKYDSVSSGINDLQESRLSIYPNPATDKITIETSGETIGSSLTLLNIEGQQLITSQITQQKTQLDISSLPSGVYFVRLTNDRTVEVGKFIKK